MDINIEPYAGGEGRETVNWPR